MDGPGEQVGFDALFEAMGPRVLGLARRLTGDAEAAQDVLQETFLAVYRGLPGFRGASSVETWVYRIAVREALRSAVRRRRELAHGEATRRGGAGGVSGVGWVGGEELTELERAIASLPEGQREAICLLSLRGVRGAVAAEVLGVPEGTVYSRAYAARAALRSRLAGGLAGDGCAEG